MTALLPTGETSLLDIPADLQVAYSHAALIINWQENLPKDEMPPEHIWPFADELNEWFDEVAFLRDQRHGGGADDYVDMDQNEWAAGLQD